ncbi:diguanylate cyclase [Vibrio mimicus]|uniref:transporter substrate-binding domain-containing diguanylate cyclase n=1 Tax=Vibrio mimicus TaxID=674 RepID=UPI00076B5D3E|nr:sensor domain-containing diguanylate cyclase [Vibrio mimicus]AMG02277.1 sensor domain-containing diguanylate cyclase [Vibrio mimicus]KAA3491564.1 sensor domain-containing diguanylate cyclase [Vibrio mimicus]
MDHRRSQKLSLMLLVFCSFLFSSVVNAAEQEKLIIANSKAWKPYSYIDDQGKPSGILIDFWLAFGQVNNVDIEFKLMDWNDSLEAVKYGKADIQAGLIRSPSREKYLDFGEPLLEIDTQLYVHQRFLGEKLGQLLAGNLDVAIGIVKGGFEQEFAQEHFPHIALTEYVNNELLMQAVNRGELDAFIADSQVANFYIVIADGAKEFMPAQFLYSAELRPAVAKDNMRLLNQIDEGFTRLTTNEKNRILSRWVHIETVYPRYLIPGLVTGTLMVVILYALQLRRTVRLRTRQLEEANHKLTLLSQTDSLTGIHNRHYFFNQLTKERDHSKSLTLMVFDIDDFKRINDTYGHGAGDSAICLITACVRSALEPDMEFARIGGEEFAILVHGKTAEASQLLAELICQRIAEKELMISSNTFVSLTISLGCAFYPSPTESPTLHMADSLMYEAKGKGKNQVVFRELL